METDPKIPTDGDLSSKDLISLDNPDVPDLQGDNIMLNLATGSNSAQNAPIVVQDQVQDQNNQNQNVDL